MRRMCLDACIASMITWDDIRTKTMNAIDAIGSTLGLAVVMLGAMIGRVCLAGLEGGN